VTLAIEIFGSGDPVESSCMNILIENAESREYLANNGEWTKNANEGRDFGSTQAAYEAATSAPIGRFNIVCYILQKPRFIIITMDQGTGKGTNTCPVQGSSLVIARPWRDQSSAGRKGAK
jgi:hypothetical protein